MSWSIDQEVPESIPGSAVEFFSIEELFHSLYEMYISSAFVPVPYCVVIGGVLALCTGQGRPLHFAHVLIRDPIEFTQL